MTAIISEGLINSLQDFAEHGAEIAEQLAVDLQAIENDDLDLTEEDAEVVEKMKRLRILGSTLRNLTAEIEADLDDEIDAQRAVA